MKNKKLTLVILSLLVVLGIGVYSISANEFETNAVETTDTTEVGAEVEEPETEDIVISVAEETTVETEDVELHEPFYGYESVNATFYTLCDYDVKAEPSPDATVIATLTKGTAVTVVAFPEEGIGPYYKIYLNGEVGYINILCLDADASYEPDYDMSDEAAIEMMEALI